MKVTVRFVDTTGKSIDPWIGGLTMYRSGDVFVLIGYSGIKRAKVFTTGCGACIMLIDSEDETRLAEFLFDDDEVDLSDYRPFLEEFRYGPTIMLAPIMRVLKDQREVPMTVEVK